MYKVFLFLALEILMTHFWTYKNTWPIKSSCRMRVLYASYYSSEAPALCRQWLTDSKSQIISEAAIQTHQLLLVDDHGPLHHDCHCQLLTQMWMTLFPEMKTRSSSPVWFGYTSTRLSLENYIFPNILQYAVSSFVWRLFGTAWVNYVRIFTKIVRISTLKVDTVRVLVKT